MGRLLLSIPSTNSSQLGSSGAMTGPIDDLDVRGPTEDGFASVDIANYRASVTTDNAAIARSSAPARVNSASLA